MCEFNELKQQHEGSAAPMALGLQIFHCPFCPEYFALDVHQIQHHLRINHDQTAVNI
ncbi:hypothetical protein GGI05_000427 [Coemansia sp. RSA 2603]|nr:hypothetical protein GGI05_000427 [Coemansia sp. RSA 2603]